jgi:hypothetical protein
MTRDQLLETVVAALDERLCVDDPPPFGPDLIVSKGFVAEQEAVLVVQPRGPQFAVSVSEISAEVAS